MIHSLDGNCEHNDLQYIHSSNNLMGLFSYDAYCPNCDNMVYSTKGLINQHNRRIIIVPWTINRSLGYTSDEKEYNEIVVPLIKKMEMKMKQYIITLKHEDKLEVFWSLDKFFSINEAKKTVETLENIYPNNRNKYSILEVVNDVETTNIKVSIKKYTCRESIIMMEKGEKMSRGTGLVHSAGYYYTIKNGVVRQHNGGGSIYKIYKPNEFENNEEDYHSSERTWVVFDLDADYGDL